MVDESSHFSGFVEKTTAGVLNLYDADYKRQQVRLAEFLSKQSQLLSTVDQELGKLILMEGLKLEDMMNLLKTCQTRLHAIKDHMRKASAKAAKLKERSLRIQQIKQKEALDRELQREAQLIREQEMVAKSPSNQKLHSFDVLSNSSPPKPLSDNLTR